MARTKNTCKIKESNNVARSKFPTKEQRDNMQKKEIEKKKILEEMDREMIEQDKAQSLNNEEGADNEDQTRPILKRRRTMKLRSESISSSQESNNASTSQEAESPMETYGTEKNYQGEYLDKENMELGKNIFYFYCR